MVVGGLDGVYAATVREIKTIGFYLWRLFIAMWSINQPTTQINAHISRDSTGGTFKPDHHQMMMMVMVRDMQNRVLKCVFGIQR